MALITIEEYAELHGRCKQAVEYQLRKGKLKFTTKYNTRLIDSKTKYPKSTTGAGRPNTK